MDLIWQKSFATKWLDSARQGRLPHAALLTGPPGTGKRAAACWIAKQRLGIGPATELPAHPLSVPDHADLRWISPPEDKHSILIDQVRELVSELSLTSYEGQGKVAVIEPAQLMTASAANSLLKTLEEPPGDTLLILVADRTGRLPATIFSRCQRFVFRAPSEPEALAWLDRLQPGNRWLEALRVAGGAPLAAIEALEQLDASSAMARDFAAVADGSQSPIDVAGAWAKMDPRFVLDWLAGQVQAGCRAIMGVPGNEGSTISNSVLSRMDSRNLFCYLDIINRLRGQPGGSFNVQVTLEGLLIDWATGLDKLDRA